MTAHRAGHTAYLRVYEPLAAFEGAERQRWEAYLAEQEAPGTSAGAALEHEAALQALVGLVPAVLPELPEHAYVTEVDGVTLLCPWRTRLRSLEALEEFLSDVPRELVSAWVPAPLAASVGEELDAHRLAHPDERVPQLTSTWHVPLRWFVLVDAGEREVHLGPSPGQGAVRTGRSLVYRTPMSRARRRVARALAVLRRTVEDGVVTADVEDLGRWLEEFHPRSLVELDYGGLVHLLDDAELSQDESARDVALALAALAEGDTDRAAAAYTRVTARMKALQAVESSS
ncbi:MAG: hypothetical protein JWM62_731 [Frankiales bacterium]|jgi:hypothetical protein|nr:hypothetical protein [Frankiales bacterium]